MIVQLINIIDYLLKTDISFKYHDRAWNTGSILAVVDTIQTDVPTATINMNPTTNTSWNVIVSLSNFNRPQTPIVTFTWQCITLGTCIKNSSINHIYLQ